MTIKDLKKSLPVCCFVASFLLAFAWIGNYRHSSSSSERNVSKLSRVRDAGVTTSLLNESFAISHDCVNGNTTLEPDAGMESSLLWKPKTDDVNLKVIFIRIPKTGSRTMGGLVEQQLSGKGFRHVVVKFSKVEGDKRRIFSQKGKVLFSGHTRHMEFQWPTPPIYISITRDPVERFKSYFSYSFYGDKDNPDYVVKNMMFNRAEMAKSRGGNNTIPTSSECILQEMPFCMEKDRLLFPTLILLCGWDPRCSDAGEWAYNNAVKHVNGALAVGVSEETDDFLRVVERLAPDLFSNIYSAYKQPISMAAKQTTATKSAHKEQLTSEAEEKLRGLMKMECRIYNYIKDRFHQIKKELLI
ncbi:uronyl 2-sulfotransferase-like isoform X2 [Asterias rubens]|uniref:uronyl 2-sulfotransferase-like isoform X2 n=1 Tax=Asterias rubens TaxID=7604 RepID=UPI001455C27D|nr:uronyl 2-sulfotransferase-like isoform X2 [Asterias rubens]